MRPNLTLGILGGMGPAATAEFLMLLTEKHRPLVIRSIRNHHLFKYDYPGQNCYLLAKVPALVQISNVVLMLCTSGADVLAVPATRLIFF